MSIVTMKNKTRATRNVKIQNKINNMGYGTYLKNKVRGSSSCPNSKVLNNTIKSRVNNRINYDQYIISKKICSIRKILMENCKNNITKKKASSNSCQINKTPQPNYGKYPSSLGGKKATLKQRILNSCGCTKDLSDFGTTKYQGSGHASSAVKRLERIIGDSIFEDNQNKNNNARNAKCGVY
tara:strand:+ start:48 stop:593 length:546 start_codon:yes stop_codon:yes gene_type:complete